jgi:ethanolamine ammonia-lyase large subunit
MPRYGTHLAGEHFTFADLRTVLACASPRRSGDELAGLAASDQVQRVAARYVLADLPLARFLEEPPLAPGRDEVSRLILDAHDAAAFGPVGASYGRGTARLAAVATVRCRGARSAGARNDAGDAAVCKLMRNQDLIIPGGGRGGGAGTDLCGDGLSDGNPRRPGLGVHQPAAGPVGV